MLQWIIIVFTALPPHIAPKVQYIPVPSEERCIETIERLLPEFEASGLIFRLECKRIKFVEETEDEEGATVDE